MAYNEKHKVSLTHQSIFDLKENDFSGVELQPEQKIAIDRFDPYRLWFLNQAGSEEEFHKRFHQLQAMANLSAWSEFLNEKYTTPE